MPLTAALRSAYSTTITSYLAVLRLFVQILKTRPAQHNILHGWLLSILFLKKSYVQAQWDARQASRSLGFPKFPTEFRCDGLFHKYIHVFQANLHNRLYSLSLYFLLQFFSFLYKHFHQFTVRWRSILRVGTRWYHDISRRDSSMAICFRN